MPDEIDFTEEDDPKIEKTSEEIIDDIAKKELDIPDPDDIIKKHEKNVRNGIPEEFAIELSDGEEVSYKRVPSPTCNICKHIQCEDAEKIYIESGFDLDRVKLFFKSQNIKFSTQSIRRHFEDHCDFGKMKDGWLAKAQTRRDELLQHSHNLTELFMGDVINVMQEAREDLQTTNDMKDRTALYSTIAKFQTILQGYEKLRAEKSSYQESILQEIKDSQYDNLQKTFNKLLSLAKNEDERKQIAQILQSFDEGE